MISTTCPGCSAKFQVPEELVTGKTVRFRCRKCGGAIEVDGTKKETAAGAAAPPSAGKADADGRKRTSTLVYGLDSAGPAKAPAPPAEATPPPPKVEPVAAKPAVFDLALTPPPPNTDDLWDLPPEALTVQPQKPVVAEVETKPARVGAIKKDAAKPETPKPEAAKPEAPKPPIAASDSARTSEPSKPESPAPSKPGDVVKLPSKAPVQSSPASVRKAFGLDTAGKDKPAPASDKAAPASDKKPAAVASEEAPPSEAGAKAPKPKPLFADRTSDATMGRRTRGAMELGGVFAAKEKEGKPAADEVDLDVEVDLEDKLELKPLIIGGGDRLSPPPAPQLKKVVLDMSEVGTATAPESTSLPSVAFFSPVLVQQAALAAPVPLAEPSEEEKAVEKQKSSKAMVWAAIIAGVGVLAAGGILLFTQLGGQPSAPTGRTGSAAETATSTPAATPPPQVGVRSPEPAASAAPAATPEAPPASSAPATADTAKPGAEPTAKAATDTKEPAGGTKKPDSTAEAKTAATTAEPGKPEPAKPEPAKPEAKQPQPADEIPFDKAAASAALNSRKGAAAGCKQEGGPTGHAKVSVTFAPSGRVTTANIMGPPFAGTPVGGCIASKFRGATVPPFSGPPVTVSTSVAIF